MGATTFLTTHEGDTAGEAFQNAIRRAEAMYGTAGYTGTIAEKSSYQVVPEDEVNEMMEDDEVSNPGDVARALIEDERFIHKWGPAGCIALGDDEWMFFGWASE